MKAAGGVACVILAGGEGRRLGGGVPKPLVGIAGRPMIRHVLDRVAGRVDAVLVGANDVEAFGALGFTVVPDRRPQKLGPLAALEAAMLWLAAGERAFTHILSLPGDTPFLPDDLLEQMIGKAGDRPVVAAHAGNLQFAVTLWPMPLLGGLGERLERGELAIRDLLAGTEFSVVDFGISADAPGGDPFFNVNTSADLACARATLGSR